MVRNCVDDRGGLGGIGMYGQGMVDPIYLVSLTSPYLIPDDSTGACIMLLSPLDTELDQIALRTNASDEDDEMMG